jgi:hypothetical protein
MVCYSENIDINQSYYIYLDELEDNLQVYFEKSNNIEYKKLIISYKKLGEYIELKKEKIIKEHKTLIIKNPLNKISSITNINNTKIINKVDMNNSTLINTKVGNFIDTNRVIDKTTNINQNFEKLKVFVKKEKKEIVKNIYINSSVGENHIGN